MQPLRLVERPALALAQALVLVQAERQLRVLVPAQAPVQIEQRVLAVQQVLARALAKQALQKHSPHQQLQSQCRPELCRLH